MKNFVILLALLALGGCSAATAPGSTYRLTEPRQWGSITVQWLTTCSPNPTVGTIQCNVTLTGDSHDEEAWQFEARGLHCRRVQRALRDGSPRASVETPRLLQPGDAADRSVQGSALLQAHHRGLEVTRF